MPVSFSWSLAVEVPGAGAGATTSAAAADTAFRDFALGGDDDLLVQQGDLVPVAGAAGIASDLRSRLQTFLGECFLDTGLGVPWLERVLGRKPTTGEMKSIFREAILGTPGIATVTSLDVATVARELRLTFKATTATGEALSIALGLNLGGS